jgi:hypothetical protein
VAGFTSEEVSVAVDRFLLKQVEVPQLKTGARDVLTARNRIYDLLTTALLLRPDSYFYVIFLASNRLQALVTQQIADLDVISIAGPNTTRPSKRIKSTTDLAAAQAALLDLNAGLNQRNTGVRGSIGPSVDRFRKSISSFVSSELTKNVLVSGQVTETGPELRSTITAAWANAVERHPEIVRLATNIAGALSILESVRLPETSVRDIVSRIQARLDELKSALEGEEAIAQSRSAMLELLTMRTLLTKASTFRNPELVLMPKTRDSSLVSFVDSSGVRARITGAISGPFNYDSGAVLNLSVNGGTPVPVTLPRTDRGSRAELRSRAFSPWVLPTNGDEIALTVDFGATISLVVAGAAVSYADGATAAATLNAGLGPSIQVIWDAAASQLVFQSTNEGDASHLRLLIDTVVRQNFRSWAFPVATVPFIENKGEPVPATEVLAALSASPLLAPQIVDTHLADFTGERTSVGGEGAVLWDRRDSGADLVSTGAAVVSSPSKNFQTLGIKPGMALHTTAPAIADYAIQGVGDNTLTLSPSPPAGVLTYYIGPDYRSIPDAARVQVTSGSNRDNSGFYRVAAGGGQVARIVVDRALQTADRGLAVSVFTRVVMLEAVGTTTSSGIGVLAGSTGATALGLAVAPAETRAQLTRLQLVGSGDFLLRGVRSGDIIKLTSPALVLYEVLIESVEASSLLIEEGVFFESGNWTYEIRSSRADAFTALQAASSAYLVTTFALDFTRIDTLVGRLIRGARYSGEIVQGVADYRADLNALNLELDSYFVPQERTIDNVVRTLREQGLDRALDLFLTLEVGELFSMEPDGVSYTTWLVRKSATVAREVVPVSKYARSDRIVQEWRPVSFQPDPFDPRGEDTQR